MLDVIKKIFNDQGNVALKVKVRAGAGKTAIKEIMEDGTIKIDVAGIPEKGKANSVLTAFLAKEFDVPRKSVKIISGVSSKVKLVKITK